MKEMGGVLPPTGCPHSPVSFSVVNAILLSSMAVIVSKEDVSVATSFLQRRCSLELAGC